MKASERFLAGLKFLFQKATLIASVLVFLFWVGARAFGYYGAVDDSGAGFISLNRMLNILLGLSGVLAIAEIARAFERPDEQKLAKKMAEDVEAIRKALPGAQAEFVSFPKEEREYTALFSGFSGTYLAYNPCYHLEQRPGLDREALVENVYMKRYKDPNFKKAHYLFLTGDTEGRKDLENFRELMTETLRLTKEVRAKIEVRQLDRKKACSEAEVYFGTKNGVRTAIVEPVEKVLTGGRGKPHFYLLVTDAKVNDYFERQFQQDWELGIPVDIFQAKPAMTATPASHGAPA